MCLCSDKIHIDDWEIPKTHKNRNCGKHSSFSTSPPPQTTTKQQQQNNPEELNLSLFLSLIWHIK